MEFMHEFGLLIAVALPAAVIFAINVALALGGERGTLLLPRLGPYPTVYDVQAEPAATPEPAAVAEPVVVRSRRAEVVGGFGEDDEVLAREAA
jgi:hypothetical protein